MQKFQQFQDAALKDRNILIQRRLDFLGKNDRCAAAALTAEDEERRHSVGQAGSLSVDAASASGVAAAAPTQPQPPSQPTSASPASRPVPAAVVFKHGREVMVVQSPHVEAGRRRMTVHRDCNVAAGMRGVESIAAEPIVVVSVPPEGDAAGKEADRPERSGVQFAAPSAAAATDGKAAKGGAGSLSDGRRPRSSSDGTKVTPPALFDMEDEKGRVLHGTSSAEDEDDEGAEVADDPAAQHQSGVEKGPSMAADAEAADGEEETAAAAGVDVLRSISVDRRGDEGSARTEEDERIAMFSTSYPIDIPLRVPTTGPHL